MSESTTDHGTIRHFFNALQGRVLGGGDQWDNHTRFDFHGNALSSLNAFRSR